MQSDGLAVCIRNVVWVSRVVSLASVRISHGCSEKPSGDRVVHRNDRGEHFLDSYRLSALFAHCEHGSFLLLLFLSNAHANDTSHASAGVMRRSKNEAENQMELVSLRRASVGAIGGGVS